MKQTLFKWAVVGAGPAGIAAIGKLLDYGVSPQELLWIDPEFNVGDLGTFWQQVSSNTTVQRFIDFLTAAHSFQYTHAPMDFELNHLSVNETCTLRHVVEPLQWISSHLRDKVIAKQEQVLQLDRQHQSWLLTTNTANYCAKQVILATGSLPMVLNYQMDKTIPLSIALDKTKLTKQFNENATYGVFGSSHSAMIVLRHLVELGAKKIINFYRSPNCYALDMGNWILFDNTGLKGDTAIWAKRFIDGVLPPNLVRYKSTAAATATYIPECDYLIYALGFERRKDILVNGEHTFEYNPHVGIIAPGLFGLGIAYPELWRDPFGQTEYAVGLWKFMVYLERVLPIWLQYS